MKTSDPSYKAKALQSGFVNFQPSVLSHMWKVYIGEGGRCVLTPLKNTILKEVGSGKCSLSNSVKKSRRSTYLRSYCALREEKAYLYIIREKFDFSSPFRKGMMKLFRRKEKGLLSNPAANSQVTPLKKYHFSVELT